MDIAKIIKRIKAHPNYAKVGMVLYHNGVVRGTSRNGSKIIGLSIEADYELLDKVLEQYKKRDGIVEIVVEIDNGNDLSIGDDVMFIAVAGDIRENVISTLTDVLNTIKSTVTKKTEFLAE